MRREGNCGCCRDTRRSGNMWRRRRLGEMCHVFSVTLLLFIDGWGLEGQGGGGTEVGWETLDVEETLAPVTGLFVFGTTI